MNPISGTTPTEAQTRALDLFRSGKRFLLAGHVHPDGDCIGAQAALSRVLEALGKEVFVLNPDAPEPQFDYLSRAVRFKTFQGGELPAHDVCVLLDISELSRCGALEAPLSSAPSKKIVVDHHIHQGRAWWDECFVDVKASATGLLVARIARCLGVELDAVAAAGVFTSLVTDTGWFKYSNADAETLALAGELVGRGVKPHELYSAIFQRSSAAQPLALGRALALTEFHAAGRLALVALPQSAPGEPELSDSDALLDLLRAVGSVEVVLFLRENKEGAVKLSARSKRDLDVNALARRFGGGGHAKASGATLRGPLHVARAQLLEAALQSLGAGASA